VAGKKEKPVTWHHIGWCWSRSKQISSIALSIRYYGENYLFLPTSSPRLQRGLWWADENCGLPTGFPACEHGQLPRTSASRRRETRWRLTAARSPLLYYPFRPTPPFSTFIPKKKRRSRPDVFPGERGLLSFKAKRAFKIGSDALRPMATFQGKLMYYNVNFLAGVWRAGST